MAAAAAASNLHKIFCWSIPEKAVHSIYSTVNWWQHTHTQASHWKSQFGMWQKQMMKVALSEQALTCRILSQCSDCVTASPRLAAENVWPKKHLLDN